MPLFGRPNWMLQINNIAAKIAKHKTQIVAATEQVIASGWMVLGPEVKQFETSFANYLNAGYCVGLANGTDAIGLNNFNYEVIDDFGLTVLAKVLQ